MAKPFDQVATMQDVYEYARDSYLAAIKPGCVVPAGPNAGLSCYCPQSAPQYKTLADKIKADGAAGVSGTAAVETYKSAILAINAACRQEVGYVKPHPTPTPTPSPVPPNGMPVQKAGFPWWLVLLLGGGALAYYFYTKKSKATSRPTTKKRRKYGRIVRRRKGSGVRRRYTIRRS
jgi:hypothetical protein